MHVHHTAIPTCLCRHQYHVHVLHNTKNSYVETSGSSGLQIWLLTASVSVDYSETATMAMHQGYLERQILQFCEIVLCCVIMLATFTGKVRSGI